MKTAFANQLINIAAAALIGAAMLLTAGAGVAQASNKIVARVSISQQTMQVLVDGRTTFEWKVSTAARNAGKSRAGKPARS